MAASLPCVAQGSPTFHFAMPAQAGGNLEATGASWALVILADGMEAEFGLENGSSLMRQEQERLVVGEHRLPGSYDDDGVAQEISGTSQAPLPTRFEMKPQPKGPASFYIEGQDVRAFIDATDATLDAPPGECLSFFLRADPDANFGSRPDALCPAAWPAVIARPNSGSSLRFRIEGHGIDHVQWHNMQTHCANEAGCPPGGAQENQTTWLSSTDYVRTRRYVFEEALGPPEADAAAWGEAKLILIGGVGVGLDVNGWIRLPLASSDGGCPTCLAPTNQTLSASGNIMLSNLEVAPDGGLQGELSGHLDSARFDETPVDASAITGTVAAVAAAVAAAGFGLLLKFLFGPLFTRNRDDDLLRNDRRRHLYDYVVKNPGVHFREALRATGIPAGSGRHHIDRLVAAGLLTQRRQRSSLLLFENHKRFHANWQDWAALRDPKLRQLHDWLTLHPDSKQKDILDSFRKLHGWPPTTTQRRLERLVRDGVAEARTTGRQKFYSATKASTELIAAGSSIKVPVAA